jgi:hypothetical protein
VTHPGFQPCSPDGSQPVIQIGGGSVKAAAQWQWGDVQNAMDLFAKRMATNLSALTTGAATPADLPLPD